MILAGIAIVLGVALWALYRFSQFGLSTRAAAESERYAMYAGVSPRRLSLVNSLLASIIAGAFGILVAPLITLNTTTLPLEIVPALGAALFAGFSSLGVACFAGLLMGARRVAAQLLGLAELVPAVPGQPAQRPGRAAVLRAGRDRHVLARLEGARAWRDNRETDAARAAARAPRRGSR